MGNETDLAIFNVSELERELTALEYCYVLLAKPFITMNEPQQIT